MIRVPGGPLIDYFGALHRAQDERVFVLAHPVKFLRRIDEHIGVDWKERDFSEPLDESFGGLLDENQVEVAVLVRVAARLGAEENNLLNRTVLVEKNLDDFVERNLLGNRHSRRIPRRSGEFNVNHSIMNRKRTKFAAGYPA